MDMSQRLQAVEAAQDLLRRFHVACPTWQDDQTPLEEIASWLGCEIATFHPHDYPDGTYGFLEPGEPLIWLCRDLPMTLQRFTLAHELGHVILHSHISSGHDLPARVPSPSSPTMNSSPDDPCQLQDVSEELTGLLSQPQAENLLGTELAYDPRSQRELAANLFAAELLMPLERVWDLYVIQGLSLDTLATRFSVSLTAMLNRLAGLFVERPGNSSGTGLLLDAEKNTTPTQDEPEVAIQTPVEKSYDEFQRAAIEAPTPALIVAGPGSGKTSTLIGRVDYLIRHQGLRPGNILALTFSRKAAQEMQERVRQILPNGLPAPTISTFHAFCAELLRTHGQKVGLRHNFSLLDDAEGFFLLQSVVTNVSLDHYQNLHNPTSSFKDFLKAISRAKDELITPAQYRELAREMAAQASSEEMLQAAERALEVAAIYEAYQQRLEQRGDCDFGSLLMLSVKLLTEHPDIYAETAQRYQHILVDEFQDINRASGVLLRLLAGPEQRVWVVGDANQAIYAFRGASPANIAHFEMDYPNAIVLPLKRNYRSRPDIVHLADTFRSALLEKESSFEAVQTTRNTLHDPSITLAVATDESSELGGLVRDIQQKLADGYQCSEIAVLCRTRAMVRKVKRALAQAALPVSVRGGMMEQEHTKDLLSLLLLITDTSSMGILRTARLSAHALSQEDIESLLLEARSQQTTVLNLILREDLPLTISAAGSQALIRLAGVIKSLLRNSTSVWSLLARYLLQETSQGRNLLRRSENAQARAICEDYASLLQFAHTYDLRIREMQHQEEEHTADPVHTSDIQEQLQGFLDYVQILLSLRQEGEAARNSNEEAENASAELHVMTVHASKGLEFPVVYLPGLARRRFPLQKRFNPTPPPAGMLSKESETEQAHESGEACLFYVGATRARDQLILSYSERYGKQNARRSGFVDALVVGLPDDRVQRVLWQEQETAIHEETAPESGLMPIYQPSQSFIEAMSSTHLKATQLEDYQACPRRYLYSTIYHFHRNDSSFLTFWQSTNETIKTLVERAANGDQSIDQNAVAELFRHHWREHSEKHEPFALLYEQHGLKVAQLVWQELANQVSDWHVRQSLIVELAGRTIEITIDRVEAPKQNEQPTRFIRTRFGKSRSKPAIGTRELLYLHAQRQHHNYQQTTLHTHNLSTGEMHEVKVTTRKEESLLNDLLQAMEGIERQDFAPQPDTYVCAACPFFLICPA